MKYTMKDLREYISTLEDWQLESIEETEEEIYMAMTSEEAIINKKDNTVTSSRGSYNSIHDIVEDLLNRWLNG